MQTVGFSFVRIADLCLELLLVDAVILQVTTDKNVVLTFFGESSIGHGDGSDAMTLMSSLWLSISATVFDCRAVVVILTSINRPKPSPCVHRTDCNGSEAEKYLGKQ